MSLTRAVGSFEVCTCGHSGMDHDIYALDDPRPSCCVEGCGCRFESCPDCHGDGCNGCEGYGFVRAVSPEPTGGSDE